MLAIARGAWASRDDDFFDGTLVADTGAFDFDAVCTVGDEGGSAGGSARGIFGFDGSRRDRAFYFVSLSINIFRPAATLVMAMLPISISVAVSTSRSIVTMRAVA